MGSAESGPTNAMENSGSPPSRRVAASISAETSAPVIPAALWGTANIWPKGYAKRWRPGQDICVRVGKPMTFEGRSDNAEGWQGIAAEIMDEISLLVASIRNSVPDRRRPKKAA